MGPLWGQSWGWKEILNVKTVSFLQSRGCVDWRYCYPSGLSRNVVPRTLPKGRAWRENRVCVWIVRNDENLTWRLSSGERDGSENTKKETCQDVGTGQALR